MSKRSSSPSSGQLIKRSKPHEPSNTSQIAISNNNDPRNKALIRNVQRTSSLEAPIVSLAGAHSNEILSCRFSLNGQNVAACSSDRSISLWRTYPPNTNYALLSNLTKAPILDLQWSSFSPIIYAVSADHLLTMVDTTTGERVRKIRAHKEIINCVDSVLAGGAGVELVATGSDDGTVKVWEGAESSAGDLADGGKRAVATLEVGCPVTAVAWAQDGQTLYVGAVDNEIHVFDLRKQAQISTLSGHTDTPTSLAISPNGHFILSPSLSSQTLIHDIRPFSPSPTRIHRTLHGAPAGFENTLLRGAWSKDDGGKRVAVGGADRTVCIWDVESSRVLYKLPGHKGTVTSVDFHPQEPIILTGSKDGTMILGEIEPSVAT
ncbi:WD40 repeat-like protein [Marasmius fiardii PR-910]|nr:WD40 repeat-like protein [Marasmius fiardii PR-910]